MFFVKNLIEKNVDMPFIMSGPNVQEKFDMKDSLKDGLKFVRAFRETMNEFFPDYIDNEGYGKRK